MDNIERLAIQRVTIEGKKDVEDMVTKEQPLTIILNNQELVTLLCSPTDLKYLAIGFLFSEGFIEDKDKIKKIIVDDQRGVVRVETGEDREFTDELLFKRPITSAGARTASFYRAADVSNLAKIESRIEISALEVFKLVKDFPRHSQIYLKTGGVHSAALCDNKDILVFAEDIGRHNALDKIFGECILRDIPTDDRIVITSGRIPSEMLLKVAKRKIPIMISISAPTDLGVKLAMDLGMTLIGFVRGERMNVYTHGWRVIIEGK